MPSALATGRAWLRPAFDRQILWLLLGSLTLGAWFNVLGYGSVVALPERTGVPWERFAFLASAFLAYGAIAAFPAAFVQTRRSLQAAIPPIAWAGTGLCVIAYEQTFVPQFALAITGYSLVGLSHAWLALSLAHIVAESFAARRVAVYVVMAGLIQLCMPWSAFARLSASWQILIAMALPLIASLGVILARRRGGPDAQPEHLSARASRVQLMQMVAIALGVVILRAASSGGIWGGARSESAAATLTSLGEYAAAALVYIALAAVTILARSGKPLNVRHRAPLLVAIGGLLLVSVRPGSYEGTSTLAVALSVFEIYYQALLSLVVITAASLYASRAPRVIGLAYVLTNGAAIVWMLLFENSAGIYGTSLLVAAYVLIMVTALYPSGGEGERAGEGAVGAGGAVVGAASAAAAVPESRETRCAAVAIQHGLTPRESEILCLLAEGRSLPFIQTELHLAEGTVRGHAYHIYQKLGIHDRQELIDLVSVRRG